MARFPTELSGDGVKAKLEAEPGVGRAVAALQSSGREKTEA